MASIITLSGLKTEIAAIKKAKQKIVLVGGCFDILHIGHIKFLKEAKKYGDLLMVFLESDEKVKRLKGPNKPVFSQEERAEMLIALQSIDFIILLPNFESDEEYDELIKRINPEIIAITENDINQKKKRKQIQSIGGKLIVIPRVQTFSSSKLAKIIGLD